MSIEKEKIEIVKKTSQVIDEAIGLHNAITGVDNHLYNRLKMSMTKADSIDIIVSFLMESGVKLLLEDIRQAVHKGKKIRILTGNYLNITQPSALYKLKGEFKDKIHMKFYNVTNKSFHPKAYFFHSQEGSEMYIGSSNISKGALTDSVEWNYRLRRDGNEIDFDYFAQAFDELFEYHSVELTDDVLDDYSRNWRKPKIFSSGAYEREDNIRKIFEPRGAQIEALYALEQTRQEGMDKALVVAATGIGKTFLAAFDSKNYKRILFLAHTEDILRQAKEAFCIVRENQNYGYFYGENKDIDKEMTFALVQTLGKDAYLTKEYFAADAFDYIIVDEFHHAAANGYQKLVNYFKPKFLLGITATPERLDNKDVFKICDYNMVYEVRLKEAINKGWLVPFRYYGIYDDTVDYSQINMRNGRYNTEELEDQYLLHKRAEFILKNYQKYPSKRALGFCISKAHAEHMARYFKEQGIEAAAVYSGKGGENTLDREEAINQLDKGEVQVLFSVDMFNEGIDVKAIDMVMFLRPTESPTIFLQQLGRGLRQCKGKAYLNVLDFIGNYKKANLAPFLLSGKPYDKIAISKGTPLEFEYPEDCMIDFDFRLVDLFKIQAQAEMSNKEKVLAEYRRIKEDLGYVPSRVEFMLGLEETLYQAIKGQRKLNPLRDYLLFLSEQGDLTAEEDRLYQSMGKAFINMIETTNMSKSFKLPILLAFYNQGMIKLEVTEEEIAQSMKAFYDQPVNGRDLAKDKTNKDYKTWNKEKWLSKAKALPIHFLLKTEHLFFETREKYPIAIKADLDEVKELDAFKKHFKDAIEVRNLEYRKRTFDENMKE